MTSVARLIAYRWLKIALRLQRPEEMLPVLPRDATAAHRLLLRAWDKAQVCRSNAPGVPAAYYSLVYDGVQFPGKRPWHDRWSYLEGATCYRRKRVLELGCNMGLLSTYVMKAGGAAAAMGVDADGGVLQAARLVARALGVAPEFSQIDLDSPEPWESRLLDFRADLVFALSVLKWVRDKARLLAFLGNFPELVYEGHDGLDIEVARLKSAGFQHIRLICESERRRPVIYCRRSQESFGWVGAHAGRKPTVKPAAAGFERAAEEG
jgi:SAM-dependent methyltransferase